MHPAKQYVKKVVILAQYSVFFLSNARSLERQRGSVLATFLRAVSDSVRCGQFSVSDGAGSGGPVKLAARGSKTSSTLPSTGCFLKFRKFFLWKNPSFIFDFFSICNFYGSHKQIHKRN